MVRVILALILFLAQINSVFAEEYHLAPEDYHQFISEAPAIDTEKYLLKNTYIDLPIGILPPVVTVLNSSASDDFGLQANNSNPYSTQNNIWLLFGGLAGIAIEHYVSAFLTLFLLTRIQSYEDWQKVDQLNITILENRIFYPLYIPMIIVDIANMVLLFQTSSELEKAYDAQFNVQALSF